MLFILIVRRGRLHFPDERILILVERCDTLIVVFCSNGQHFWWKINLIQWRNFRVTCHQYSPVTNSFTSIFTRPFSKSLSLTQRQSRLWTIFSSKSKLLENGRAFHLMKRAIISFGIVMIWPPSIYFLPDCNQNVVICNYIKWPKFDLLNDLSNVTYIYFGKQSVSREGIVFMFNEFLRNGISHWLRQ